MPLTREALVQKIIDVLKLNVDLAEPAKVKKYFFGQPVNLPVSFPIIYVQYKRRRFSGVAETGRYLYFYECEIGVIASDITEDKAEKDAYDKREKVETVLRANPTLDGLVLDAELSPWDDEATRAPIEKTAFTEILIFAKWKQWDNA